MNLTNFTEIMARGMNNPDCAFFVGSTTGQLIGQKYIVFILCLIITYRLVGNVTQLTWDLSSRKIKKWWKANKRKLRRN